jgi:RHS repeat-associated protein
MFPATQSPVSHYTLHGWDANGNLTFYVDYGDLTSSADDLIYNLQYQMFSGTHFTGLNHIDARMAGPETLVAQREATYTVTNNRPQVTQIRDLVIGGSQPVSGSPYTGTSTQIQTYNLTYNTADLGNVGTFTDPTGYELTYTYDAATKTHVTGVSDTFSLTSSRTMNQDYGLPATTTDANGKVVTYNYDSYGRLSKVWSPVDPTTGQATIQMTYSQGGAGAATPWAMTQHKDFQSTTGVTIDTVAFADGLGRIIQTKKKADLLQSNGTTAHGYDISGLIVWDANGRVMAQSQPFFDSATAETTLVPAVSKNPTVFTYDGLNRVTSSTTADGAMTQTVYAALLPSPLDPGDPLPGFNGQLSLERITDANENTTRVYRDGAGRVLFNMDAENNVTAYGYDVLNNLSTVTDANGNVTTGTYDSLSRLVTLSSPDTGETDWRYALSGLLQEKQTANLRAKGQLIKYGYMTNRPTTITYPMLPVVTYMYGTWAQAGSTFGNIAGRIASVTMEGGTESRQYDAFGNVSLTTTTLKQINNTTLASPVVTMKYVYDWLGRMETMTFPKVVDNNWNIATGDGEVITYTYDSGGRLKTITGKATPTSTAENYLSGIGYDEFATRKNLVSGNGITTAYTYDPAQHRLSTVTASGKSASGATVQFLNVTYGYDPVGNVLTVNNNVANSAIQPNSAVVGIGPSQITNTYDADNRLSSSSGLYRGHSTSGQAYSTTFLYNGINNITSKSQVDNPLTFAAGASGLANPTYGTALTGTSYTLHYSYTPGKAHQPGTIFDINSVGTQSTRTENFDADGNNTGDVINSTTRVLTWDETDRLKSVSQNGGVVARYLYTPDGVRTQKQDAVGGTTSFYFNQFLVINGSKQMTKSLFAGETRIASKTESAQLTTPVRSFYHPDNVGSTSYISNASQTLVQHERYFPTGERWSSPSEVVTTNNIQRDYLFTGKELDRDTGFYYFGARYLDPRTSNWLSTDPILGDYLKRGASGASPFNLGLYTYAWNNPFVVKDPDGRETFSLRKEVEREHVSQMKFEDELRYGADQAVSRWHYNSPAYVAAYATLYAEGGDTRWPSVESRAKQLGPHLITGGDSTLTSGVKIPDTSGGWEFVSQTITFGALGALAGGALADLAAGPETPILGRKLDYFLGRASGSAHNVARSQGMLSQLQEIGLGDTAATREFLTQHLGGVLNDSSSVAGIQANGRVLRESLLMGPEGALKFQTVWEGNKLITGMFFGIR